MDSNHLSIGFGLLRVLGVESSTNQVIFMGNRGECSIRDSGNFKEIRTTIIDDHYSRTGKPMHCRSGHVTEDGKYLIETSFSHYLCIWRLPEIKCMGRYFIGQFTRSLSVSYSRDKDTVIYCGDVSGANHLFKVRL